MKIKASITLSGDLLEAVDRLAGARGSRSAVIERLLRAHFDRESRARAHAREVARINTVAERLNAEVMDVLEYQATWNER